MPWTSHWISFALLAALSYAAYYVLLKMAAEHLHQVVGALVLQAVATLTGIALFVYLRSTGAALPASSLGLGLAAAAGVAVGAAEILTFYVFESGVPASRGTPVIVGGSIAFAAVLGIVLLREPLSARTVAGIVLVAAGSVLLAGR